MPRVAEPDVPNFPWDEWGEQLLKSPAKALFFGPDDFGDMPPRRFREQARKGFAHLGVSAGIRGHEVLVWLHA